MVMTALLLVAAQTQVIGPAGPRARAVPATGWACTFEAADGSRFRLSGRIAEIAVGSDPNASRPTEVTGEGPAALHGSFGATAGHASDFFRDYQLSAARQGGARYNISLKLRRGGAGVGDITRYLDDGQRQPYAYLAAGLCTSEFDLSQGTGS